MSQLKLDQDQGREKSKYTEENDQDDAWHKTHDSQRRGQGEHSIAHDLRYHESRDKLP